MGKLGDAAKEIAAAAAKRAMRSAYDKALHNIKKGSTKHYCPETRGKHKMTSSDMGAGWRVLHCSECGWFDHRKHQHGGF